MWIGAALFAIQIYCDFSGYTDIAIGVSKLFDIKLNQNFNFPYFSRDIAEFWRRWHISLTTWFRDYVYIPLGGNRKGKLKTVLFTIIVFLLSGLWHGANWTFISWGAFNALLFIPLLFTQKGKKLKGTTVAQDSLLPSFTETMMMSLTFLLVIIGWVLYRAENISIALYYLKRMFTEFTLTRPIADTKLIPAIIFLFAMEWLYRKKTFGFDIEGHGLMKFRFTRWLLYYIITMVILLQTVNHEAFIYFQF